MWPLMTVIFTDADLKANREGRLTDSQRKKLDARVTEKRRMVRTVVPLIWLIVALLAFGTVGLFNRVASDAVKIGIVLVWAVIGFVLTLRIWRSFSTYARGTVSRASALCEAFQRPYGKDDEKTTYKLKIRTWLIGSHTVYVEDVDTLKQGQRYRVYYLEDNPPILLSWEEQPES